MVLLGGAPVDEVCSFVCVGQVAVAPVSFVDTSGDKSTLQLDAATQKMSWVAGGTTYLDDIGVLTWKEEAEGSDVTVTIYGKGNKGSKGAEEMLDAPLSLGDAEREALRASIEALVGACERCRLEVRAWRGRMLSGVGRGIAGGGRHGLLGDIVRVYVDAWKTDGMPCMV